MVPNVVEKPGRGVEYMDFGFGGQVDAPGVVPTSCMTLGKSPHPPERPHWLFCKVEKARNLHAPE